MLFRLGLFIVIFSIIGGFLGAGGNIKILMQPFEWVIILGTAIGSFMISNPKDLQQEIFASLKYLGKPSPYSKQNYMDLLSFLFNFLKYSHSKTLLEVESHIESPQNSTIFKSFPSVLSNKEAVIFISDYFRMIVLGFDNAYELENMMESDIAERHSKVYYVSHSIQKLGDSFPALGIVAAVLGVIIAMAAVGSEASILGMKIASALVGTFIGVLFSYGIITPIGLFLAKFGKDEIKFFECIKAALISHMHGHPPSISVEFARQAIPIKHKPSFSELERYIEENTYKAK